MRVFSASEAINPAIQRTRYYLFRPFEWGTYLKLAAVACITEGFTANFNFSENHQVLSNADTFTGFFFTKEVIALIVFGIMLCLVIGIAIFYFVTRLRFAFFHCLAHQTKEIWPAWRLYRVQAKRYFKLSLIVGVIFAAVMVLAALPFVMGFLNVYRAAGRGGHFSVLGFLALFFPLIAVFSLLFLIFFAVDVTMHDFMLPHIALEDASVSAAWKAARARMGAEKSAFFFYAFLRLVLPALAMLGLAIILAIPLLIVFGILGVSIAGCAALLSHTTGVTALILIVLGWIVGFATFCLGLLVAFSVGGPVATWIRNYALIFYGGRYKALGDILVPPPAAQNAPAG